METVKNFLNSLMGVQTKLWIALGILITVAVGVWFLISTGKNIERAKTTDKRIEIIQKGNEATNEIKSLPPAARDKRLDGWVRDQPKPKPKEGSSNSK